MINDPNDPAIQDFFSSLRNELKQGINLESEEELFMCPARDKQLFFAKGRSSVWLIDKHNPTLVQKLELDHPIQDELALLARHAVDEMQSRLDSTVIFIFRKSALPQFVLIEPEEVEVRIISQILERANLNPEWVQKLSGGPSRQV